MGLGVTAEVAGVVLGHWSTSRPRTWASSLSSSICSGASGDRGSISAAMASTGSTLPCASLPGEVDAVGRGVAGVGRPGAVGAAVEVAVHLDSVADDPAATVQAHRGDPVDGTLEAVEHMPLTGGDHLERLVVFVAADLTSGHRALLSFVAGERRGYPLVVPVKRPAANDSPFAAERADRGIR